MVSPLVKRAEALRKMTHHQFLPGIGYLAHGAPPDLPVAARGTKNCRPPAGALPGSLHALQPPGGHPPMMLLWIASEQAWASQNPGKGNRLAWSVNHLARAGWEYVGPAPPAAKAKGKRAA